MYLLLTNAFDFAEIFENIVSRWYYYVALAVFIIVILLFFIVKKQPPVNNLDRTRKITYIAIFTGLSVIANIGTISIVSNRWVVSFTAIPCFLGAYLLGAKAGFVIGFIGDLVAAIVFPQGAYLPIIGIASGLLGFIPGIIYGYFKGNPKLKTVIAFVICFIVCSAFLNTFANWLYVVLDRNSTTTFWAYLAVRVWFQAIVFAVNCIIVIALLAVLPRILPINRFFLNDNFSRQSEQTEKEQ